MIAEMVSTDFFMMLEKSIINSFTVFLLVVLFVFCLAFLLYKFFGFLFRFVRRKITKRREKKAIEKSMEEENSIIVQETEKKTKVPKGVLKSFSEIDEQESLPLEEKYKDDGTW